MIAAVAWMQLLRFDRAGHRDLMRTRWAWLVGVEMAALLWFLFLPPISLAPTLQHLLLLWLDFLCRQQAAGVLLLGPALAAGSITDEKTTRTLEHLLIAPLEGRDIVWGKWLALCCQL